MATIKTTFIEKFAGDFKSVDGGCTVIHTKTIQSLTNIADLAIYIYLCSKPPGWHINRKELMNHFSLGKDKIYQTLNNLILIGLIHRQEIRAKGKFYKYEYFLNLSPSNQNDHSHEVIHRPCPDLPDTVEPDTINQDAYKEKGCCIESIEIKKSDDDFQKSKTTTEPTTEEKQQAAYYLLKNDYEIPREVKTMLKKVNEWNAYKNNYNML